MLHSCKGMRDVIPFKTAMPGLPVIKFVRYDANSLVLEELSDIEPLQKAIDETSRMLHGEDWLLGGGVAVALALGGFYRRHSDLDLIIEKNSLSGVCEKMASNGYGLYTRKLMKHGRFGLCLFVRVHPRGLLVARHPRRLCFARFDGGIENAYLAKLDVYLFEETRTQYIALDRGRILEKIVPVRGCEYTTQSGYAMRCLNLYYVEKFSAGRGGARHLLDILAIREGLAAARRGRAAYGSAVEQVPGLGTNGARSRSNS